VICFDNQEVYAMKKYLSLVIAIIMALTTALLAQAPSPGGQAAPGQGQGVAPAGGARGGMTGAPGGMNTQSINAAMAAIEQQIAALKKAMEGAETSGLPGGMGGAPGGAPGGQRGSMDMQAMMEQIQKRNQAVQEAGAAIADQALVLKGTQARTEFKKEIDELQSIADLATQQKAPKIAEFVKGIMDARQKAFQEKAGKLGIPAQANAGPMGSQEPPIKGGFEWIN
jgi:hypothetical protein